MRIYKYDYPIPGHGTTHQKTLQVCLCGCTTLSTHQKTLHDNARISWWMQYTPTVYALSIGVNTVHIHIHSMFVRVNSVYRYID